MKKIVFDLQRFAKSTSGIVRNKKKKQLNAEDYLLDYFFQTQLTIIFREFKVRIQFKSLVVIF